VCPPSASRSTHSARYGWPTARLPTISGPKAPGAPAIPSPLMSRAAWTAASCFSPLSAHANGDTPTAGAQTSRYVPPHPASTRPSEASTGDGRWRAAKGTTEHRNKHQRGRDCVSAFNRKIPRGLRTNARPPPNPLPNPQPGGTKPRRRALAVQGRCPKELQRTLFPKHGGDYVPPNASLLRGRLCPLPVAR
jgi:hypothetical protein